MDTPRACRLTPADLLMSFVIVLVLLGGCFVPSTQRASETANRVKCAGNLRQVGRAMQAYAGENNGNYPRARFDGAGGLPAEYTNWKSADPFGPAGPAGNDVTAALFLLVRTQSLTPQVFACPTSAAEAWRGAGAAPARRSNFPGRQYLSYSFANPYASPAAVAAGFRWDTATLTADFATAADMNPGPPAVLAVAPDSPRPLTRSANSANHNGDGQNVLYADGHVEFQNTPFCGMARTSLPGAPPDRPVWYRDNVYAFGAGHGTGVRGAPVDGLDSVLLPTALDGPVPQYPLIPNSPLTWVIAGLVGVVVLCVVATVRLARRRGSSPDATQ